MASTRPSNGTIVPSASSTARPSTSSSIAGIPRRRSSPRASRSSRSAQNDALGLPLAGEHLLGERRPVVGQVALGADQRDPPREPVGAQRLARPQPGERRPHDDDVVQLHAATMPDPSECSGRSECLTTGRGRANTPMATVPRRERQPADGCRCQRDGPGVVPEQRQRVHRAGSAPRRRPPDGHTRPHPARRVHLRADAVRPRRLRSLVCRVRRHRSRRADGSHVRAVDPLPPPGCR